MTTTAAPGVDSAVRQDLLERYARLAIRVGINLEPGREVAIRAMIEHAPLVRALVRAGYEAAHDGSSWTTRIWKSCGASAPVR